MIANTYRRVRQSQSPCGSSRQALVAQPAPGSGPTPPTAGSGRGVSFEPVLQGSIPARLPAFAGGLEGLHDIGVVPHYLCQIGCFGFRTASARQLAIAVASRLPTTPKGDGPYGPCYHLPRPRARTCRSRATGPTCRTRRWRSCGVVCTVQFSLSGWLLRVQDSVGVRVVQVVDVVLTVCAGVCRGLCRIGATCRALFAPGLDAQGIDRGRAAERSATAVNGRVGAGMAGCRYGIVLTRARSRPCRPR